MSDEIDTARLRAAYGLDDPRERTHWESCEYDGHVYCALALLCDDLERSRAKVRELIDERWRLLDRLDEVTGGEG